MKLYERGADVAIGVKTANVKSNQKKIKLGTKFGDVRDGCKPGRMHFWNSFQDKTVKLRFETQGGGCQVAAQGVVGGGLVVLFCMGQKPDECAG